MRYWITFDLSNAYVDVPDDLDEEALDAFLDRAQQDVDLDSLVVGWDAGEDK